MSETVEKRLAIFGAGGLVGTRLVAQALKDRQVRIFAFAHSHIPISFATATPQISWTQLDIRDKGAVSEALMKALPTVVINAAALADVDACELRRVEATEVNAEGPRHLAEICVMLGARLLHISTDYVFSGAAANPGPYSEHAQVGPVNWYGETKLRGERSVIDVCNGHTSWLIARTALVYDSTPGQRTNFVVWLVGELRAGRRVKVVKDQFNTPTVAQDLAKGLLQLAWRTNEGIYHLAGPDWLSRDELAHKIATHYNLDPTLIDTITTTELGQRALRPLFSGLRTIHGDEIRAITFHGIEVGLDFGR
jgi:dTDP-4-dehydrorhamnose reductase